MSDNSSSHSSDYEESITVKAPRDQVYDFVSDIKNMPKYMPTTKCAEKAGEERVRVEGSGDGFSYDTEGYLRRNDENDRLARSECAWKAVAMASRTTRRATFVAMTRTTAWS